MTTDKRQVSCCVVGGGPAGMMAGFLLARAGVAVMVLEKHADFLLTRLWPPKSLSAVPPIPVLTAMEPEHLPFVPKKCGQRQGAGTPCPSLIKTFLERAHSAQNLDCGVRSGLPYREHGGPRPLIL